MVTKRRGPPARRLALPGWIGTVSEHASLQLRCQFAKAEMKGIMSRKQPHVALLAATTAALAITLPARGNAAAMATVAVVNEASAPAPTKTPDTLTASPTTAGPPASWHYWPESTELQQELLMMAAAAEAQPPRTPPPDGYAWDARGGHRHNGGKTTGAVAHAGRFTTRATAPGKESLNGRGAAGTARGGARCLRPRTRRRTCAEGDRRCLQPAKVRIGSRRQRYQDERPRRLGPHQGLGGAHSSPRKQTTPTERMTERPRRAQVHQSPPIVVRRRSTPRSWPQPKTLRSVKNRNIIHQRAALLRRRGLPLTREQCGPHCRGVILPAKRAT